MLIVSFLCQQNNKKQSSFAAFLFSNCQQDNGEPPGERPPPQKLTAYLQVFIVLYGEKTLVLQVARKACMSLPFLSVLTELEQGMYGPVFLFAASRVGGNGPRAHFPQPNKQVDIRHWEVNLPGETAGGPQLTQACQQNVRVPVEMDSGTRQMCPLLKGLPFI